MGNGKGHIRIRKEMENKRGEKEEIMMISIILILEIINVRIRYWSHTGNNKLIGCGGGFVQMGVNYLRNRQHLLEYTVY